MIATDIVTIDIRTFFTVGHEITTSTRKIGQRKGIYIVTCKSGKWTAARTVAKIVARDRSAVRREDRPDRRHNCAATRELISARRSRSQQLTEIADAHSCSRYRNCLWIAGATKDRSAVALTVQREEEERAVTAVIKHWPAFAWSRQVNWTTNRAVIVVLHIVWHWRRSRIVKPACGRTPKPSLIDLADRSMNFIATRFERGRDDATTGASRLC